MRKINSPTLSMQPLKFGLWLFIIAVTMFFAALTSAYVVRRGLGNWELFQLPEAFYWSTITIISSSISMQIAYFQAKKDEFRTLCIALSITVLLGLFFLLTQLLGFRALVQDNVYFAYSNPSNSFVYVLTGLHAIHIISSVIFVIVLLFKSYKVKIHSKNMDLIEMCTTYWHFLGGLWIYLFIFMLLNR